MSHPENAPLNPGDDPAEGTLRGLPPELQSFEARLAKLSPRDDRLDRERLAFLAGQASMAAGSADRSVPARDWRRHPAWPSAFAGMSALAATLLAILVARPAITELAPSKPFDAVAAERLKATSQPTTSGGSVDSMTGTFSPRDALQRDIERLLAMPSKQSDAPPNAVDSLDRPALTPSAWQDISDALSPDVSPGGSSSLPANRGIHS